MSEQAITDAIREHISAAGVPLTEFDPKFVVRMVNAMMVSFHKYGRVADAYPLKFDAASDVRARMAKYRETANKHFLVDAANFAMIEAMHPKLTSDWGTNDAADSPGRTSANNRQLVQEANDGTRIMGETILHHPDDLAAAVSAKLQEPIFLEMRSDLLANYRTPTQIAACCVWAGEPSPGSTIPAINKALGK